MLEINYMTLDDAMFACRQTEGVRDVFLKNLRTYKSADRKVQRIKEAINFDGRNDLVPALKEKEEDLNKAIDAAFSSLTILKKEYKKVTHAFIFEGGVGLPKGECTKEEWASYRPEKVEVLDDVFFYLTCRAEERKAC